MAAQGKAIIISTHILEEATRSAPRSSVISDGEVKFEGHAGTAQGEGSSGKGALDGAFRDLTTKGGESK